MTDYATINPEDLAPQAPAQAYGDVSEADLAPAAPASVPPLRAAMQPGQQFSPGVIARFRNGDAVTKAAQALAGDYATNFNAGVADDMQKFDDLGIKQGTLRTLGQALVHGAAFVKAGITAAFPAVLGGAQAGATEVLGKEGGQAVAQATAIAMSDASIQMMLSTRAQYAEATRVKRAPDGSYVDEHLGPVPDETGAAVQAQRIADYHGMPDAAETIKESYHQGVLPVEIHTDMSPEMTADLAAKEVPKAYPVSDWTEAAGPQAARAEAPALGTTQAPKATGPTRLRPIGDQGETSVSGLAESAEASAINKQLVENFGDLPELGVAKDATQGPKAEALLLKDPELARDIALNGKQPPPGTLASAVYVAVLRKAERDGDIELIRQLGTQSQFLGQVRRMGQESSYLRNVNEGDPSVAISNLQQARRDALAAKGVDVAANENEVLKEYAPIRAQARAAKPNAWNAFINSIQCAE